MTDSLWENIWGWERRNRKEERKKEIDGGGSIEKGNLKRWDDVGDGDGDRRIKFGDIYDQGGRGGLYVVLIRMSF